MYASVRCVHIGAVLAVIENNLERDNEEKHNVVVAKLSCDSFFYWKMNGTLLIKNDWTSWTRAAAEAADE